MRISRVRPVNVGIVALAGIAILGWVRQPIPQPVQPQSVRMVYQAPIDQPATIVQRELPTRDLPVDLPQRHRPATTRSRVVAAGANSSPRPIETGRHEVPPMPQAEAAPATSAPDPTAEAQQPEVVLPSTPAPSHPVKARKQRSQMQSIAIIAGSAGAGAAIGGLSGGGKGAAIGAIAGGLGGYVYDRWSKHRAQADDDTVNSSATPFRTPRWQ